MIRIAVVDDETEILQLLERNITDAFETMHADVRICRYQSGSDLLEAIQTQDYHIIFLDLEMPGMDGFQTAERLRKQNQKAVLIFVTNREDLVFNAFQYNVTAFIRKKRLQEELVPAIRLACQKVTEQLSVLLLKTENGDMRFQADEIAYFSSYGHKVWLHPADGEAVRVSYTLEQLEEILPTESFVRSHSSVLVNCGYIFSIDKENVILTNHKSVALSRHRKKKVKEALQHYLRSCL